MEMSKAAIAPQQPPISAADRAHPLFNLYNQHRSWCSLQLVKADAFRDWLFQYERNLVNDAATKHPDYPAFMEWIVANKGGARKCPAGVFPHNFNYWREGGRW